MIYLSTIHIMEEEPLQIYLGTPVTLKLYFQPNY